MLPEECALGDLIIRSPNAVMHSVSVRQEEDDPENWIMRAADDGCWYVQADDSKTMEYVSDDWVRCWMARCGYFGLIQLVGKKIDERPDLARLLPMRVLAGGPRRPGHRVRHDPRAD